MIRRHIWWLAPLAGAAVAGGIVAAVSLGGGSSSKTAPKTSHAGLKPAAAVLAFQQAITAVVHELSPSVVQIQTSQGLGSGVVLTLNQLAMPGWFCLGVGGLAALSLLLRR